MEPAPFSNARRSRGRLLQGEICKAREAILQLEKSSVNSGTEAQASRWEAHQHGAELPRAPTGRAAGGLGTGNGERGSPSSFTSAFRFTRV